MARGARTVARGTYCTDMPNALRHRAPLVRSGTAILTAATLLAVPSPSSGVPDVPIRGGDASWPNCPKGLGIPKRRTEGKPMPVSAAHFVVLGLTNGPGFYPNPCLADQAQWARRRGLHVGAYAMTTYPPSTQRRQYASAGPFPTATVRGRLRNAGYAQATFNVVTLRQVGLPVRFVWVDVEEYPVAPWTAQRWRNQAVLDGVLRGYRRAGFRVGLYVSPYAYGRIIGSHRYRVPEWRTVGGHPGPRTTIRTAVRMCSAASVQGGRTVLSQWWDAKRDHDVLCPKYRSRAATARFFGRFPSISPEPEPSPPAAPPGEAGENAVHPAQ